METRLTALKLVKLDLLMVKEPLTPVAFMLKLTEALTDAQLNLLGLATPWTPVTVEACVGTFNESTRCFNASITLIEAPSRIPTTKHKKTLQWGQVKRKRGYISYD